MRVQTHAAAPRQRWLAEFLCKPLPATSYLLLWVTESAAPASPSHAARAPELLDNSGSPRSLEAAPGHLAEPSELPALEKLVLLGLRAGWGMSLVAPFSASAVFVTNGWAELRLEAEEQLAALSQELARAGG